MHTLYWQYYRYGVDNAHKIYHLFIILVITFLLINYSRHICEREGFKPLHTGYNQSVTCCGSQRKHVVVTQRKLI